MAVPSFSDEHLRSICKVLADTNEGLTNSEIDQLLQQAGIASQKSITNVGPGALFYTVTSKRDRLFQALSQRQMRDRCGNNVASFYPDCYEPCQICEQQGKVRLHERKTEQSSFVFWVDVR